MREKRREEKKKFIGATPFILCHHAHHHWKAFNTQVQTLPLKVVFGGRRSSYVPPQRHMLLPPVSARGATPTTFFFKIYFIFQKTPSPYL